MSNARQVRFGHFAAGSRWPTGSTPARISAAGNDTIKALSVRLDAIKTDLRRDSQLARDNAARSAEAAALQTLKSLREEVAQFDTHIARCRSKVDEARFEIERKLTPLDLLRLQRREAQLAGLDMDQRQAEYRADLASRDPRRLLAWTIDNRVGTMRDLEQLLEPDYATTAAMLSESRPVLADALTGAIAGVERLLELDDGGLSLDRGGDTAGDAFAASRAADIASGPTPPLVDFAPEPTPTV